MERKRGEKLGQQAFSPASRKILPPPTAREEPSAVVTGPHDKASLLTARSWQILSCSRVKLLEALPIIRVNAGAQHIPQCGPSVIYKLHLKVSNF